MSRRRNKVLFFRERPIKLNYQIWFYRMLLVAFSVARLVAVLVLFNPKGKGKIMITRDIVSGVAKAVLNDDEIDILTDFIVNCVAPDDQEKALDSALQLGEGLHSHLREIKENKENPKEEDHTEVNCKLKTSEFWRRMSNTLQA